MTIAPTSDRYSAVIITTDRPFAIARLIVAFAPTAPEARKQCQEKADKEGWRRPAWWQWWRRRDSTQPHVSASL